jgi:hypothetical protein
MPRISPVDASTKGFFTRLFLRFIFFLTQHKVGKVVMPVRVLANHPRILFGYGMLEDSLGRSHLVEEALKDLAQIRVATLVGCPF